MKEKLKCIGGAGRRLVDARFTRALDARERIRLEGHLAACGACAERYRRIQLGERVAAHGPSEAWLQPAPAEVDRIAADLGLLDPAPRTRWRLPGMPVALGAVAALMLTVFLAMPNAPTDSLVERGAAPVPVTFQAYALGEGEPVLLTEDSAVVSSEAHLKLRASGAGLESVTAVWMVIVPSQGALRTVLLGAPAPGQVASVPGAVSLAGLAEGDAWIYVVGAEHAVDAKVLEARAAARPSPEALADALGPGVTVERFSFSIRGVGAEP